MNSLRKYLRAITWPKDLYSRGKKLIPTIILWLAIFTIVFLITELPLYLLSYGVALIVIALILVFIIGPLIDSIK